MKTWVKIALNVGYWLTYFLLLLVFFLLTFSINAQINETTDKHVLLMGWLRGVTLFAVIPGVIGFYGGYGFLFPRFLVRRRLGRFFLGLSLLMISGAVATLLLVHLIYNGWSISAFSADTVISQLMLLNFIIMINAVIGIVMRGFITSYDDILVKEELTRKNTEVEMELVRAQLNPHFLFNTINNIDVMIAQDPERASDYLCKLSEIMRYMLYESKDERVSATVECDYIERYVELQRIRTHIPDFVELRIVGDSRRHSLAPMTLIPYIENAFKYAEHAKVSKAVVIQLQFENDRIVFDCINHIATGQRASAGGLGNALVEKRLQLIYGAKHQLSINATSESYHVHLEINQ
ncbi:MAG: sensor histidine kinase [Flavobacteriales bacterium]